ncbi:MAG: hypothetical protein KAJ12_00835, partial [Bacteroidetes bacterium]|nr:hypothetical protein [Bacteroidota bacterium]
GSRELGFDADLDLLFISHGMSARRRVTLEKFASSLVRGLSTISEKGTLYNVDTRLRPEGKSAPLISEADSYRRYLQTRASLWERQSLTRIRRVCGDARLAAEVLRDVEAFVYDSPLPSGWVEAAVAMRRKMETRSKVRGSDMLDLKLGRGGMVDIEFMVQMVQLRKGREVPALRCGAVRTLLAEAGRHVLDAEETNMFWSAYETFRTLEKLMRVTIEERNTVLPNGPKLETLARCYDRSTGKELHARVKDTMATVRKRFLEVTRRLT